jgi:hypothetical protein
VIHLQTPQAWEGYNHINPLRIETAIEAAAIDARIALAWADHPRRYEVAATVDFLSKATRALAIVRDLLPACCRAPDVPALQEEHHDTPQEGGLQSRAEW